LESEIDQLITGCEKTIASILQLLKENGMRIGEASRLKWTDLNLQNNTITLNEPEKHGKARMFKASVKLIGMLQALPKKNEGIFGHGRVRDKEHTFQMQRQKRALVRSGFRFNLEFVCFIKKGDLRRRTRSC